MTDNKMTLDEMVDEMNKTHALVLHDGRCMVFIQSEDSNQFARISTSAAAPAIT